MRVAITGLAASRPQAEIAADISTSLEALLFAQRQHEGQRCKVADPIDLDQRLRLRIRFAKRCVAVLPPRLAQALGPVLEQIGEM